MRFDPDSCADAVLASYHNVNKWQDIRTGIAAVLRHIAESSSPVVQFALDRYAREMEPAP